MTIKLEQAARQALEALESLWNTNSYWHQEVHESDIKGVEEAITALRKALAEQAEQEPVAYKPYKVKLPSFMQHRSWHSDEIQRWLDELPPLYIGPVRTKNLTDDEIAEIVREVARGSAINRDGSTSHRIARAVIAADREKNK